MFQASWGKACQWGSGGSPCPVRQAGDFQGTGDSRQGNTICRSRPGCPPSDTVLQGCKLNPRGGGKECLFRKQKFQSGSLQRPLPAHGAHPRPLSPFLFIISTYCTLGWELLFPTQRGSGQIRPARGGGSHVDEALGSLDVGVLCSSLLEHELPEVGIGLDPSTSAAALWYVSSALRSTREDTMQMEGSRMKTERRADPGIRGT